MYLNYNYNFKILQKLTFTFKSFSFALFFFVVVVVITIVDYSVFEQRSWNMMNLKQDKYVRLVQSASYTKKCLIVFIFIFILALAKNSIIRSFHKPHDTISIRGSVFTKGFII